ncbi:hypothetical protein H5410_045458 [Solanum commersonii]|uniref:Uncharacterized protein n=1 Tax=Solanum commersonii TaxID=4109 RepID=A0A9J5XDQ4_SOLCO|nr:hypothetical protein H5410_045458 [Solanum commersonii]
MEEKRMITLEEKCMGKMKSPCTWRRRNVETNIQKRCPQYQFFSANHPIAVIGSEYCTPNQVDVAISRKVKTLRYEEFVVSDMNGNFVFKVKGTSFGWHDNRVILDAADNPLITLKQKHLRWNAFKGENTDEKDFLFTIKTTTIFQWKTELAVFLAINNSKEKV